MLALDRASSMACRLYGIAQIVRQDQHRMPVYMCMQLPQRYVSAVLGIMHRTRQM